MKKLLIPVGIIIIAIIGYASFLMYDLRTITANGTVKAERIENIMIDFPAYIKAIYVADGQRVVKGQPLLLLDLHQYQTQIIQKEQELRNLRNELQQERSDLGQLKNDLAEAEAALKLSQDIQTDKEKLYEQGMISRYELEEDKKESRADQNRVANLKQSINAKTGNVTAEQVILENIDAVEFELQALKNKYRLSGIRGNQVLAPVSGVIYDLGYHAGDVVDDEKKLLSILNDRRIYVDVNVPELLIKDIRSGSKILFTPIAYDSFLPLADRKEYTGRVAAVSGMAVTRDNQTFFPVKVKIDHSDRYLVPFLNGKVKFIQN